jgi:TetR/AcrR family transcriptional regulator, transcriptional repressor for nem operon
MARHKEFDPAIALQKAMHAFWRLGYEHTSLEILMDEMEISKQSLYDTFGDKRSIYLQAMKQYRETTNGFLRELFAREGSVKKGFKKLFQAMISESAEEHERGCLLMNTNLSRPTSDLEIKAFLQENQQEVEAIFVAAFREAQRRGEIAKGKNPTALAKFFVATIQGMRALARLNQDRKELELISRTALAALDQ